MRRVVVMRKDVFGEDMYGEGCFDLYIGCLVFRKILRLVIYRNF